MWEAIRDRTIQAGRKLEVLGEDETGPAAKHIRASIASPASSKPFVQNQAQDDDSAVFANKVSTEASLENRLDITASGVDSDMKRYKVLKMTPAEVSLLVALGRD